MGYFYWAALSLSSRRISIRRVISNVSLMLMNIIAWGPQVRGILVILWYFEVFWGMP